MIIHEHQHEPHTVSNEFITAKDIDIVVTGVKHMLASDCNDCNDHSNHIVTTAPLTQLVEQYSVNIQFRMLPLGMYAQQLLTHRVKISNQIMRQQFGTYYDCVQSRLSEYYGEQCIYAENLQLPGFHVYTNSSTSELARYSIVNYHQDRFDQLESLGWAGSIDSWIIPLEIPRGGSGLQWSQGIHQYQPGQLIMWPGRLRHTIAGFELEPGEARITGQMHVVHDHKGLVIFW